MRRSTRIAGIIAGLLALASGEAVAMAEPIVIGHRGASAYRPEHTLGAYQLAIDMGADFIEPDLVITKDGVLVARHGNEISTTTDVADKPEFAARKTTKSVDGVALTGWFTEDFTLAELKTLRAKERIPQFRPRNTVFNGRYTVPTFQEVLDLRARLSRELGREIGVYPETKHPSYFRNTAKLPLEEPLIEALRRNKLDKKKAPVFVQSFETQNLKMLNEALKVPIVQLLSASGTPFDLAGTPKSYAFLSSPAGLAEIAEYADGIGPAKDQIVPRAPTGSTNPPAGTSLAPTTLVADAHAEGLLVHPYTFRAENAFLPLELRFPPTAAADPAAYGNLFAEIEQFFKLGVDGVFTDNPDFAVEVRDGVEG